MSISVIIPTINEQESIGSLIDHLRRNGGESLSEIIVCDGGSTDMTIPYAEKAGAIIVKSAKGRNIQMNEGAKVASSKVLYFVHADTWPPDSFASDILKEIDEGHLIGGYRFRFSSDKIILKLNSFMTRYNKLFCRGGDQTIFITKELFEKLGGYNDEFVIMEEYDLMIRSKKHSSFKIIPKDVLVSARKYENNSYLRVNYANYIAFKMFSKNKAPQDIYNRYMQLLNHPKK